MFYRRKFYIVKSEFVETFNTHFNKTNLPTQLKYGSRLVGRWMKANNDDTVEIFAIWLFLHTPRKGRIIHIFPVGKLLSTAKRGRHFIPLKRPYLHYGFPSYLTFLKKSKIPV
ncbi:hypothetical protein [Lentibacillus amyloliquefaciens]|uniref:hypothetical protein n=1 Tax=Lentibacillus amyloliquefaciens TaxID=1472767 RepID=UPI001F461F0B|nr:hypothetical protein [Lentibacillus amyloliquefaciens]